MTKTIKSIRNLKAFESSINLKSMKLETKSYLACIRDMDDISSSSPLQQYEDDPSVLLEQSMLTQEKILELFPQEFPSIQQQPVSRGRSLTSVGGDCDDSSTSSSGGTGITFDLASLGLDSTKFISMCLNIDKNYYTCAICNNNYKNRKSMARHLKEQHIQGSIFQCKQCGVSYKRREKLLKHNRERHLLLH